MEIRVQAALQSLAASSPAVLPLLVLLAVLGRLLGGPAAAVGMAVVFILASLPGVALYPLLRPAARGAERVAGGLALGIPIECIAFVIADRSGLRNPFALVALLAGGGVALFTLRAWLSSGSGPPRPASEAASRSFRLAVGLTLLLGLAALMYLPPALSLGAEMPDGSRAFVRNFGLDFLRHLALAQATARGPLPPAWYFTDGAKGDSYWLHYPGPALMLRTLGAAAEPWRVLLGYDFLLLAVFLTLLAGRAGRGYRAGALGVGAAIVFFTASNLRGVASLVPGIGSFLMADGRFVFTAPLFFALFMGHHLLAIVLLLLLHALYRPGARGRMVAGALAAGFLLPVTVFISPFVGVVAGAWALLLTLYELIVRPSRRRRVAAGALALAAPGLLALGLYVREFGSGFSSTSHSGLETRLDVRVETLPLQLVVCMAPMLFVAGAGWRGGMRGRRGHSAGLLAMVSLLLAGFLVVRSPGFEFTEHEVATKTGMVFLVALALFAGSGLRSLFLSTGRPRWAPALAVVLLALGLVNSAAYVRSYSDLASARTISAGDWEAARWIRRNLPPDARIIVSVSHPYGPKNYSFLPPLAGRQVLEGRKGDYLRPDPLVAKIDGLYLGQAGSVEWWAASHPGWYVYCGGSERSVNPEAIATLERFPGALREVYRGDGVRLYQLLPADAGTGAERSSGTAEAPQGAAG